MNYVDVCAGIDAASVAWKDLGWNALLLSEIAAFPRTVLRRRQRAVDQRKYNSSHIGRPVLWGDFTALRPRHLRRFHGHTNVDLLVGGTPCQSYSIAGQRAGLDDPRGELSLEFALLAYRLGVRWFLWENVPGVFSSAKGQDFAAILSAFTGRVVEVPKRGWRNSGVIAEAGPGNFGVGWCVRDAQHFGVPQRRRRVFVVGYLGDWRRAAAVLFESYGLQRHSPPRREKAKDVAPTISSRPSGGGGLGTDFDLDGGLVAGTMSSAGSRSRGAGSDPSILVSAPLTGNPYADNESREANLVCGRWPAEVAPTLNAHFGDKRGLEDQHIRGGEVYSSTGETAMCLNAGGMGRQDFETETLLAVGGFPDPYIYCKDCGKYASSMFCACDDADAKWTEEIHFAPQITHALRGEGFDASEDGTGRGTPIVPVARSVAIRGRDGIPHGDEVANAILTPNGGRGGIGVGAVLAPVAIQAGALRENPNSGPDGIGVQEDIAYTLEARSEVQAVAYRTAGDGCVYEEGDKTAPLTTATDPSTNILAFSCKDHGADASDISPTLRSMGHDRSHANAGGQVAVAIQNATRGKSQNGLGITDDGTMYTLDQASQHAVAISGRARGDDGRGYDRPEHLSVEVASTLDGVKVDRVLGPNSMAVRRLTPRECERLQGFPDDYTLVKHRGKPAADGPRYKALGNSMAVPVMRWLGERIQMVDDIYREEHL